MVDPPMTQAMLQSALRQGTPKKVLMQRLLHEFMIWHASLLRGIIKRQQHPNMTIARQLSDLDQREWREQRRQQKMEAKRRMERGALLHKQTESGKRKFEDMSATEQQVLEDFRTQKSKDEYEKVCAKKPPHLIGKMMHVDMGSATEQTTTTEAKDEPASSSSAWVSKPETSGPP